MSKSDDIRKAIKNMQPKADAEIFWARVISVQDDETCTIKLLSSGLEIDEVSLSINQNGVVAVPEDNSQVLACSIEKNKSLCYVISVEKIKSYLIRVSDLLKLGGDSFGGLIKIEELKTQIDKNSDILTNILNILNGSPVTEPGNGAPSALQAALKTVVAGKQTADLSNIENQKVKHG